MSIYGVGNQVGTANTQANRKVFTEHLAAVRGMTPREFFAFWHAQTLDMQDQLLTPNEYEAMIRLTPTSTAFTRWASGADVKDAANGAGAAKPINWVPLVFLAVGAWLLFSARR